MKLALQVQGVIAHFPRNTIESKLTASKAVVERTYGGVHHDEFHYTSYEAPLYWASELRSDFYACGLGALLWLESVMPDLQLQVIDCTPARTYLRGDLSVPPRLRAAAKWRVKGAERFYFFEALEACRQPMGSVKLPTGAGKTEIELTLAENSRQQFGLGLILVPSQSIFSDFLARGERYGLNLIPYRQLLHSKQIRQYSDTIAISTPQVLVNDLKAGVHLPFDFHWLICDEVHHIGAEGYLRLVRSLQQLSRLHGFSALPVDADMEYMTKFSELDYRDATTVAAAGPIIYQKSAQQLKQYLNLPIHIDIIFDWTHSGFDLRTSNWKKIYHSMLQNAVRNHFIAQVFKLLHQHGYNFYSHVYQKVMGESWLALLQSNSTVCWWGGNQFKAWLPGSRQVEQLNLTVANFRSAYGSIFKGVITTSHALEGLDFQQPINAVVYTEGKSNRWGIQKLGRALRPSARQSVVVNIKDVGARVLARQAIERSNCIRKEVSTTHITASSLVDFEHILQSIDRFQQVPCED